MLMITRTVLSVMLETDNRTKQAKAETLLHEPDSHVLEETGILPR